MTCEGLQSMGSVDLATAEAVRAFLARLEGRFEVRHAILYGSRARGDFRPDSDADMALVLAGPPADRMAATLVMADEAFDVLLATGIRISPWSCGKANGRTRRRTRIRHCWPVSPAMAWSSFERQADAAARVDRPCTTPDGLNG